MRMLHQIAVRLGVLVAADLGSPVGLPWPGALAGAWVRRSGRWGPGPATRRVGVPAARWWVFRVPFFAWNGYACGVSLFGFTVSSPHGPVDSRPALQAMAEAIRTNQLQTPVIEPERAGFALARLSDARAPRRGALVDR